MRTSEHASRPAPVVQLLLALALVAVGCGVAAAGPSAGPGATGEFDPADTEVRWAYQDSSVPPPYHRSYEITIEDREAHVVVDSYGEVIHDVTVDIPDSVWTSFVRSLHDGLSDIGEPEALEPGCAGGTAVTLELTSGGTSFERHVENCSSERNEVIDDQLEELLQPLRKAIDLDSLTAMD